MFRIFNHFIPKIATLLLLIELLMLVAAPYLAVRLRFSEPLHHILQSTPSLVGSAAVYAQLTAISMAAFGIYELHTRQSMRDSVFRLAPALVVGACLTIAASYFFPELYFGRDILALTMLLSFAGILTLRLLAFHFFKFRILKSRVVFLGDAQLAKECMEMADSNRSRSRFRDRYHVIGIIPLQNDETSVEGAFLLPNNESLMSIARKYDVHEIVISLKHWRGMDVPIHQLLECKISGITVSPISRFFEREVNQIRINYLQPSWLLYGDGFGGSMLRTFTKRTVDLLVASLLLLLTFPVMALAALAIMIEDGRPVLYRQERVGKKGKPIMVLKFRSMHKDAEKSGSPQWAAVSDPRVTGVGHFLRKTRIDELPQLINVLKGEMSFVGPRPERPYFVNQLCEQVPFYNMRHSIKPGITGFAQVRYQYGSTVEDAVQKLQYDLYYIKNHTLFLDLLIIIDTVQVVLFAKGSR